MNKYSKYNKVNSELRFLEEDLTEKLIYKNNKHYYNIDINNYFIKSADIKKTLFGNYKVIYTLWNNKKHINKHSTITDIIEDLKQQLEWDYKYKTY